MQVCIKTYSFIKRYDMYFIYEDSIYQGNVIEQKTVENWHTVYTFHKPKSKVLQDNILIFDLYVADTVEELKDKIVKRANGLTYKEKKSNVTVFELKK